MRKSITFGLEIDESAGEMVLSSYSTTDPEVVKYFVSLAEDQRQTQFDLALKLGVVALRTMGTAQNVDYVEKCFDSMFKDFSNKLESALGDKGTVKQVVDEYFGDRGSVTDMVEKTFGDDGKFAKHLKDTFGPDGKIVKEIFDPSKEGTPLAELKNEIIHQFTELRKDFASARKEKEIVGKTPLKGKEFETHLEGMISRLAEHHADIVENTSNKPGKLDPSKKGDLVVTLSKNPDMRIVFEAKDVGSISFPELEREMKEAIANRSASYGVFVAKSISTLPANVGWFNEYNGDILAIALGEDDESQLREEILKIGYKWARLRLLSGKGREIKGIDAKLLHDKVEEAGRKLKTLSGIKSSCTKAEEHIHNIRETATDVGSDVKDILDEILEEIHRSTDTTETS
jgi:hypothetical protein